MSGFIVPSLRVADDQWEWLLKFPSDIRSHPNFLPVLRRFANKGARCDDATMAEIISEIRAYDL